MQTNQHHYQKMFHTVALGCMLLQGLDAISTLASFSVGNHEQNELILDLAALLQISVISSVYIVKALIATLIGLSLWFTKPTRTNTLLMSGMFIYYLVVVVGNVELALANVSLELLAVSFLCITALSATILLVLSLQHVKVEQRTSIINNQYVSTFVREHDQTLLGRTFGPVIIKTLNWFES
jgi:hypothetical protein